MNISSILRRKGTHVETAAPGITLGQAARRLRDAGIGSLVVLDGENRVTGVLAERDLVRALAEHGEVAPALLATALVARPVPLCKPGDSLEHVLSLMTSCRARHVPVVADGVLVGIVSIGDLVKAQLENLKLEVGVLRDYARMRA